MELLADVGKRKLCLQFKSACVSSDNTILALGLLCGTSVPF
jgi:hypothetical protein